MPPQRFSCSATDVVQFLFHQIVPGFLFCYPVASRNRQEAASMRIRNIAGKLGG